MRGHLPCHRQHQRHRQITDCVVAPARYHLSPRNRKVPGACISGCGSAAGSPIGQMLAVGSLCALPFCVRLRRRKTARKPSTGFVSRISECIERVCDVCATPSLFQTGAADFHEGLRLTPQRVPAKRLTLPGSLVCARSRSFPISLLNKLVQCRIRLEPTPNWRHSFTPPATGTARGDYGAPSK